MIERAWLLLLIVGGGAQARAENSVLPRGVGAVQIGSRAYGEIGENYDAGGNRASLARPFERDLTGRSILSGSGGDDLKKLGEALRDYDGAAIDDGPKLVDELDMGKLSGDVKANVRATYVGAAFGIGHELMLLLAVPWVEASSEARLSHTGGNNALAIKEKLGDLAFTELQDGLGRAATLSERDVYREVEAAGYGSIERWEGKGFGDLQLAAKTAKSRRLAHKLVASAGAAIKLSVPTGRGDDPDELADVPNGKGYAGLGVEVTPRVTIARLVFLGFDASYIHNFERDVERRVPEGEETLVAADRKTTVRLDPGDDTGAAAVVGGAYKGFSATLVHGERRHRGDRYDGSLPGNYGELAASSEQRERYDEIIFGFDTIAAFRRRAFPVPFMLGLTLHRTASGENVPAVQYLEASVTGFFSAN